jgi:hypothetical protein
VAELSTLEKDWDSYGAEPPSPKVIALVKFWLEQLLPVFPPHHIRASAAGGAAFCWFGPERRYAHIEFHNEGEIIAAMTIAEGDINVWEASDVLKAALEILVRWFLGTWTRVF